MPQPKNRELISISTPAHQHLKAVVAAMKKSGIPTSGTMLASQLILAIPFPQPVKAVEVRKRAKRATSTSVAVSAL